MAYFQRNLYDYILSNSENEKSNTEKKACEFEWKIYYHILHNSKNKQRVTQIKKTGLISIKDIFQ